MAVAALDTLSMSHSDKPGWPNQVVWREPEAGDPLDPLNHLWSAIGGDIPEAAKVFGSMAVAEEPSPAYRPLPHIPQHLSADELEQARLLLSAREQSRVNILQWTIHTRLAQGYLAIKSRSEVL